MSQPSPPKPIGKETAVVNRQLRDKRSLRSYIYALMAFKKDKDANHAHPNSEDEMQKQFHDQSEDDTPRTVGQYTMLKHT
jgi:hypothetical protein